jgi:ATP-dependent exoDNAse (exonuclease V) beta subunit
MTVHKAKGLEFPVVILADITARLTPWDANRHVDHERGLCAVRIGGWSPAELNDHKVLELERERREGERVAYVAATRARDLLVIPAIGDEPYSEGWIAPLNAAVYPAEDARRVQVPAAGCPIFKSKDTVLNRPGGDPASSRTVCPGTHAFGEAGDAAAYDVVWWSPEPELLPLGAQAPFGLRRDDLMVKDVPPQVVRQRLDTYNAWKTSRDAAVAAAKVPSIEVKTATELALAGSTAAASIDVSVETIPDNVPRPRGTRFGTLVHALLADVAFGAPDDRIDRLAAAQGRVLGASPEEVAAAAAVIRRTLAHRVLQEAAAAARNGQCHRETPVTCRLDDGTLVEGTVDLAYATGDGMVVVDFKTDRAEGEELDRYRRQVAIYADAVARAMGVAVRAVLMQV